MVENYDTPWKDVLENWFEKFMAFFFPDAWEDIDWKMGYEQLDTEFQKLFPKSVQGRKHTDKLVKVWRKSGGELVVLVHTEVQVQPDSNFAKRMFTYHYRISDRYDEQVVSLAVLGDTSPDWRPNNYVYSLWGCRLHFEFPTVKLIDYREHLEQLENHSNPFAFIVAVHLKALETKNNMEDRRQWKMHLIRRMYKRNFARETISSIFRFIDWLMELPADLDRQFIAELRAFEQEIDMTYITTLEKQGLKRGEERGLKRGEERGLKKGEERGLKKGEERGLKKGEQKGELNMARSVLRRLLNARFGQVDERSECLISQAGLDELNRWIDHCLDASSQEAVFRD